jgi:hypothetical protein
MGLPKEVIAHAIRSSPSPDKAAELIEKYESRREKVAARRRRAQSIRDRAEKEIEAIMQMDICQHEIRKTHGDPSGGSDRSEECLICGEFLSEKQVRFT